MRACRHGWAVFALVGALAGGSLAGCGDDDGATADGGGPGGDAGDGRRDGGGGGIDGGLLDAAGVDGGGVDSSLPSDPQLVQIGDLEYAGAFRVPADMFGISELNYSQGPIEVNAAHGSIYIVGHTYQQAIAEFPMPALVMSDVLTDLNMAGSPMQTFASVLDRTSGGNPQGMDRIASMKLFDGASGPELVVNAFEYYDAPADDTQTTLVMRDADHLGTSAVDGYYSLGGGAHAAGWISAIPSEWQARLGGTTITGASSGMPIISRLSVGPSAFVLDPDAIIGAGSTPGDVATEALLDFDLTNPIHGDLSTRNLPRATTLAIRFSFLSNPLRP